MFVYIHLWLLQSQPADNVCSRDAIKEQIEFSLPPMGDLAPSVICVWTGPLVPLVLTNPQKPVKNKFPHSKQFEDLFPSGSSFWPIVQSPN